jgi:hypothetical protein
MQPKLERYFGGLCPLGLQQLLVTPAAIGQPFEACLEPVHVDADRNAASRSKLKPHVSHAYALSDTAQALQALLARRAVGKLVIRP